MFSITNASEVIGTVIVGIPHLPEQQPMGDVL